MLLWRFRMKGLTLKPVRARQVVSMTYCRLDGA